MKNRLKHRWNRGLVLVAGWVVIVGGAAEIGAQTAAKKYAEIQVTGGGTITGKVTFSGEVPNLELRVTADKSVCTHTEGRIQSPRLKVGPEGGVAETVVYLKNITEGKPVAALAAPALLDQEGCVYKPFIQVAPFKGTFTITNSDKLNHNVHMKLGARSIKNLALPNTKWPKKDERQIRMTRPGIISVNCDVHSWMGAYIFVVRHPYYAVTDAEGRFELTDVPPGEYEVALWHAGWSAAIKRNTAGQVIGYNFSDPVEESMPVKIEPDGSVEVNFTLKD